MTYLWLGRSCEAVWSEDQLRLMEAQQAQNSLPHAGQFRTLEIHLTIQRHQQLNSLEILVIGGKRTALVDELVGQVFDGVSEGNESAAGLGTDATTALGSYRGGKLYRSRKEEAARSCGHHCECPQVIHRPSQIT